MELPVREAVWLSVAELVEEAVRDWLVVFSVAVEVDLAEAVDV